MQFEYDPEKLIEEVRKRPGLWDYEHVQYRSKFTRNKLWSEVVKTLLNGNANPTKSELRELELQIQKKWKCIRDNFVRYLHNPNRTSRPYIYSNHLVFLLKEDQDMPTDDKGESESQSDETAPVALKVRRKRGWLNRRKITLQKDSEDELENQDDVRSNSNDANLTGFQQMAAAPSGFAFANVEAKLKDDEDCDKLFLLSLLPHLKAIPEESKLNAKMQLMQVLNNASHNYFPDTKIL